MSIKIKNSKGFDQMLHRILMDGVEILPPPPKKICKAF
jgi:hypothetical protein